MFFESRGSLIVAAILVVAGCFQSVSSRKFAEAARREASAVGMITYVSGGRGQSYYFGFVVNGYRRSGLSASCHTPLSYNGCAVGAPVRVYYDPAQIVETTLQRVRRSRPGYAYPWHLLHIGRPACGCSPFCVPQNRESRRWRWRPGRARQQCSQRGCISSCHPRRVDSFFGLSHPRVRALI